MRNLTQKKKRLEKISSNFASRCSHLYLNSSQYSIIIDTVNGYCTKNFIIRICHDFPELEILHLWYILKLYSAEEYSNTKYIQSSLQGTDISTSSEYFTIQQKRNITGIHCSFLFVGINRCKSFYEFIKCENFLVAKDEKHFMLSFFFFFLSSSNLTKKSSQLKGRQLKTKRKCFNYLSSYFQNPKKR